VSLLLEVLVAYVIAYLNSSLCNCVTPSCVYHCVNTSCVYNCVPLFACVNASIPVACLTASIPVACVKLYHVTHSCINSHRAATGRGTYTCGRAVTVDRRTTATVTATRRPCGPSPSTRPPTTARRPDMTSPAPLRSPLPSATARVRCVTPAW